MFNQVRITMTDLAAEFFIWDEVNRLKIIQDIIDQCLITQITTQMLASMSTSACAL